MMLLALGLSLCLSGQQRISTASEAPESKAALAALMRDLSGKLDELHNEAAPHDWTRIGRALEAAGEKEAAHECYLRAGHDALGVPFPDVFFLDTEDSPLSAVAALHEAGFDEDALALLRKMEEPIDPRHVDLELESITLAHLSAIAEWQARMGDRDAARATRDRLVELFDLRIRPALERSIKDVSLDDLDQLVEAHLAADDPDPAFALLEKLVTVQEDSEHRDALTTATIVAIADGLRRSYRPQNEHRAKAILERLRPIAEQRPSSTDRAIGLIALSDSLIEMGDLAGAEQTLATIQLTKDDPTALEAMLALVSSWENLLERQAENGLRDEAKHSLDVVFRLLTQAVDGQSPAVPLVWDILTEQLEIPLQNSGELGCVPELVSFAERIPAGFRSRFYLRMAEELEWSREPGEAQSYYQKALDDLRVASDALEKPPARGPVVDPLNAGNVGSKAADPRPTADQRDESRAELVLSKIQILARRGDFDAALELARSQPDEWRESAIETVLLATAAAGRGSRAREWIDETPERLDRTARLAQIAAGTRWYLAFQKRTTLPEPPPQ